MPVKIVINTILIIFFLYIYIYFKHFKTLLIFLFYYQHFNASKETYMQVNAPANVAITNFIFSENKTIGKVLRSSGVYIDSQNTRYMLKTSDHREIIAEYIGSYFAREILGDRAPLVQLTKDKDGNIYTASKFLNHFIGREDYRSLTKQKPYTKYEELSDLIEVTSVAEFVNHGDLRGQNDGVIIKDNKSYAAIVDFDRSLQNLRIPLDEVYLYRKSSNVHAQILKEIIDKLPDEFIKTSLMALFVNLEEIYQENMDDQRKVFEADLLNRKKIFISEIALLELESKISTSKYIELTLTESPSRALLRATSLAKEANNQELFIQLDNYMKQYTQDKIYKTIDNCLTSKYIIIHRCKMVIEDIIPYVKSEEALNKLEIIAQKLIINNSNNKLLEKICTHSEFTSFPNIAYNILDNILKSNTKAQCFEMLFPQITPHQTYRSKIVSEALLHKTCYKDIIIYLNDDQTHDYMGKCPEFYSTVEL